MKKIFFSMLLLGTVLFGNNFGNIPVENILNIQIKNINLVLPKTINNKLGLYLCKVKKEENKIIYVYKFKKETDILKNIRENKIYKKEIIKVFKNNLKNMFQKDEFVKLLKKNKYQIINKFYYKNELLFEIKD